MTRSLALAGGVLLGACVGDPRLVKVGCMLATCVDDPALVKVGYQGPVTRTSEKSALILLTSGLVEGVGGATRSDPRFHFNEQDQRVFVASLGDELNRLKLLRAGPAAESAPAAADVAIEIVFQKTQHLRHYYLLDVVMRLKSGERTFVRRYIVNTEKEPESAWEKLNSTAPQGKVRAARILMARVIPDIEQFVADSGANP